MRFRPRAFREEPEINFIPLIDVLLVILIFLMVTTTYSRFAELQINLPTAEANKPPERLDQIDVGVDAQGQLLRSTRASSARRHRDALAAQLKRAAGGMKDPGHRHQRRRRSHAPVGHPRHGSRAGRRLRQDHVHDPDAEQVTCRELARAPLAARHAGSASLLYPLSLVFRAVVALRRAAYSRRRCCASQRAAACRSSSSATSPSAAPARRRSCCGSRRSSRSTACARAS